MKIPFSVQGHIKSLILILCCASLPLAQGNTAATSSSQTVRPIGMILAIDSAAKRITIKTELDPAAKEITIKLSSAPGAKPMVITFAPGAALRRYAPNSVKFSDARASRFEELKVGDQVRALGTGNEDRSRYTAEELVSGSFRTTAAVIVSHDATQNTILVTDLASNKRIEARLTPDSIARRLSPEIVQMLAARNKEGSAPDQGARDLHPLIEKLPHLNLADLKPGGAVIISFANSEDTSSVTVITLLAGVEPLLKTSTRGGQPINLGSWNLDLNMNVGAP